MSWWIVVATASKPPRPREEHPMSARTNRRETRRFRLAGNENEIVVSMTRGPKFPQATGEDDVEGHGLTGNDTQPDSMTRGPKFPQVSGGDDDAPTADGGARR